jgi:hypothetical protein
VSLRREYFEVISLSTAGLVAQFWDLNAYKEGVTVHLGMKEALRLI